MRIACLALAFVALTVLDTTWTLTCANAQEEEDCVVQEDGTVFCSKVKASNRASNSEARKRMSDYYDDDDAVADFTDSGNNDERYVVDDDDDDYDFEDEETETETDADPAEKPRLDDNQKCTDNHELCSFWASSGECTANPNYMTNNCQRSCNTCTKRIDPSTGKEARNREERDLLIMVQEYGVAQDVSGTEKDMNMFQIRKTVNYMKNHIFAKKPTHKLPKHIIDNCTNNHELCAFWAAIGECEVNVSFMQTKCAPSCQSCASIDFDERCPKRDENSVPGLKPGELNQMFERLVNTAPGNQTDETQLYAKEKKVQEDGTPYYTVHVHSRPESKAEDADENGVIAVDAEKDRREAPWVITFENFLTDEECDHLIELGYNNGYERSKDVGKKSADGSYGAVESYSRTSENAWCSEMSKCRNDDIAKRVQERIANVTEVPSQNFEDFQMLKYTEGQFYRTHHDYIEHQVERACGPRILTFFLYLSDVEEGGGTGLGQINGGLVVNPKKGKALLWPSVMNYDPSVKDGRTTHEAISVGKGTKFAANSWIHLYDVVETQRRGCT